MHYTEIFFEFNIFWTVLIAGYALLIEGIIFNRRAGAHDIQLNRDCQVWLKF